VFEGIPPRGLAVLLKQGQKRNFGVGTHLFREGEVCDSVYIILRGRVAINRSHPHLQSPVVLVELGPSQVVGSVGVLDSKPRSSTATAVEQTEVVELSASALARALIRYPRASARLLRLLSRDLHSVDELSTQAYLKGWNDDPTQLLPV
jgi:CRP/FNR family transcriptional regulator, cyclic AMP receptor protein